ncbi:DUF1576 domain-containing protein [Bengtsoniella intestinalis]|uniref:DUF1576 domain-containing protein n=1 Tax=Bengtsoniella intestinalis TaxID=3073143 RepID=UPI00391F692D
MPHTQAHLRYEPLYPALMAVSVALIGYGFLMDSPQVILQGLYTIISNDGALITDYIALAGPGAAFCNAGLVGMISVLILHYTEDCLNGLAITIYGLMVGFALFGKNIVNIWPILFGTYLYAKSRKESFSKYSIPAMMITCLAPVVSYVALDNGFGNILAGAGVGVFIGFIVPPLAAYTYRIQNGMNLYNVGFACGLVAMMLVPLLDSLGASPQTYSYWSTEHELSMGILLTAFCLLCILVGFLAFKQPVWAVWAGYRRLLKTSGRSPSDYLRMFGPGPALLNVGINGLVAMTVLVLAGGDLNGPTLGGIFTIMGFSTFGKHIANILPVMGGVLIGAALFHWDLSNPGSQLALLFCTTLAPMAGYFGWRWGVVAGFLHSSVVLFTASPVSGMNLYNNGFSGGLIAIVLYPLIIDIAKHRKITIQDEDFFEPLVHDEPVTAPGYHQMAEEKDD